MAPISLEEHMAMTMSSERIEAYRRYERRVEDWNEGKWSPPSDPPPSDPPKWRGDGLIYFKTWGPNPQFGIAQRARIIASRFDEYFSSYEDEDEGEDEEKDKRRVDWLKGLLDELEAYDFESIDVATVLHSYNCLIPFLGDVLSHKHAFIRSKGAELITSMVQNHPTSQQLIIEGDAIQLLLHNFTTDLETTSRTKTLGAISSLIRNNKSGITVFLRENGYEALRDAFNSGTVLAAG